MANDKIQIEFKVLNDEFKSKLAEMGEASKKLNRDFKLQKEQMKLTGSESDKLKASTDFLGKKYQEASKRVNETKAQLEQAKAVYGENSNEVKRLEASLSNAEFQQAKFGNELKISTEQLQIAQNPLIQYGTKLGEIGSKFTAFGEGLKNVGTKMTTSLTLPLVALGGASLKMATDFNEGLANIGTLIPKQTERLLELKSGIQDIAIESGKSTNDITNGTYQVISALGDSADTLDIVAISSKGASAGLATTNEAVELGTAVTKAYGDTSAEAFQKVMDLSFATVKYGQTSIPALASSIGKVTPLTKELGVSQEELFAVMSTATGVTGDAAIVTTQFKGVLSGIMSPTTALTGLYQKLGIENGEAMIKQYGLVDSIKLMTEEAKATGKPLSDFIGSIEGQTLALALTGSQYDTYGEKLEHMKNAVGSLDEAFLEQTSGINEAGFQFKQAMVKMQVAGQKFGDALVPVMGKVADVIGKFADWLTKLSPAQVDTIVKFGMMIAVIGPVLSILGSLVSVVGGVFSVFGFLSRSLGAIQIAIVNAGGVFTILKVALVGLKAGFMFLISPIGLIIAGIVALIAIGVVLYKNWDQVKAKLIEIFTGIKENASKNWDLMKENITSAFSGIKQFFNDVWTGISEAFTNGINFVKNIITTVWGGIVDLFMLAWNTVLLPFRLVWETIKSIVSSAITLVSGIIGGVLNVILYLWQVGWQIIKDFITPIWDTISKTVKTAITTVKDTITNIMNTIKDVFTKIWNTIKDTITTVVTAIKDEVSEIWNNIKDSVTTIVNAIKDKITEIWNNIKNKVAEVVTAIKDKVTEIWNNIKTTTSTIWNNIKSAVETPINAVKNTVSNVVSAISTTVSNVWNSIKSVTTTVWNGIKSAIETPINAAKNTVSNVINAIKGFFSNLTLRFPKISMPALPHFSLTGSFSLNPPSVPKLGVKWYSQGGIFKKPTVLGGIGVGDGYKGVGSGMEAVLPIDKLAGIIRNILPNNVLNPTTAVNNIINFNGNYNFKDQSDIDYFLNESAMILKRRKF